MSITLEHLSYVYNPGTAYEKHALKDVSLEIPQGQFVGIIGHTGSGKSTLIQHLNGLMKATSGRLLYEGKNIYEEGYDMKQLRTQVGLVFQYPEYQLFEVDVLSDVCFGPKNQGLLLMHTAFYCTQLAQKNMNPKNLQYIMGHASITITLDLYAHASEAGANRELKSLVA